MKKGVKKLSLNAETLSRLDRFDLEAVNGGRTVNATICTTCTHGCSGCQPCA